MAEVLHIIDGGKELKYQELIPQLEGLLSVEDDLIANMANLVAALKSTFNWLWVGFYLVREQQLVLGPFQGPIACTRINFGRGVCGKSWQQRQTIVVEDVNNYVDHIACSSLSKSEIVIPVYNSKNDIVAVLDIDSENLAEFDHIDQDYLEKIVKLLALNFLSY
jgi:GAF domain-containing protein